MIGLTYIQQQIRTSLMIAISNNDHQTVQGIFNNNECDNIQAVLRHEGIGTNYKDTFLDFAIIGLDAEVKAKREIGKNVGIIKKIWKVANQEIRDFMCCRAIDSFRGFELYNIPALKTVIQEIEEHKRVMHLDNALKCAIKSLNVDQVKAVLENCGKYVENVLRREVHWDNTTNIDGLLIYPLKVKYSKELNQEDVKNIKEIFELMFGYVSPQLRHWGDGTFFVYVINQLALAQKSFAEIPGVGEKYFQNLINKFVEELNEGAIEKFRTDDQIARNKLYENQCPQEINQDLFDNDEFNASMDDTDLGQDTVNSAPTAGNKTPEKNDTTFLSKHKGKISLGVTGLCVAGAIAAYVLAYPVVALALAVLAAVILMGAGIAKVLEDPSVEKPFTQQQEV